MNRSPYKLRLIGQHEINSHADVDEFKANVDQQCEHVSPFDLLHSFTTHPTSKALRVRTYLKVEKEEAQDGGRDQSSGCG